MQLPVQLRRYAYRSAHLGLRIWWFVAHPQVAGVKCVITHRDSVLLVRHTYGRPRWDLPGGTTKRHEQPRETARREMAEELGVTLDGWSELGVMSGTAENRHDTMHLFQLELPDPTVTANPGEIAEARWFPRHHLPSPLGRYVMPILSAAQLL